MKIGRWRRVRTAAAAALLHGANVLTEEAEVAAVE